MGEQRPKVSLEDQDTILELLCRYATMMCAEQNLPLISNACVCVRDVVYFHPWDSTARNTSVIPRGAGTEKGNAEIQTQAQTQTQTPRIALPPLLLTCGRM